MFKNDGNVDKIVKILRKQSFERKKRINVISLNR